MEPDLDPPVDQLLLACIRRANLDAFWARATNTVTGNKNKVKMSLKLSENVGLLVFFNIRENIL